MIDITGIDLAKFAQKAYELSIPQGLGFLHATASPLSDEEATCLVQKEGGIALSLDYVKGRACKMVVWRDAAGKLTIRDAWYDHTNEQFKQLLAAFNLSLPAEVEHGISCNCVNCQSKRRAS